MEDSTFVEHIILNSDVPAVVNVHTEGLTVVEGRFLNLVCVLPDHIVHL